MAFRAHFVVGFVACCSLLAAGPVRAQMMLEHSGEMTVRGFHGLNPLGGGIRRSFQSDAEAKGELDKILSAVGLNWISDRIQLRASADTANAEAGITPNGQRFIFYNATFMQKLKQKTTDQWTQVSILAHEVGHHLAFHTEIAGNDHKFELEADYFSGFVMRRLGATLDQAHAAIRAISPQVATASHPGLDQRLQIITIGWTDGGSQGAPRGLKPSDVPPPGVAKAAPPPSQTAPAPPPASSTPAPRPPPTTATVEARPAGPPIGGAAACADNGPIKYCVSSVLPTSGVNTGPYGPRGLFDGDPETAWVEGKSGDGVGEWIVLSWPDERQVAGFTIVNGYAKTSRHFEINGRVKRLQLEFSGGESIEVTLQDTVTEQRISVNPVVRSRWVRLRIGETYRGSRYPDTAITALTPIFN
ncbi:MAG: NADase-type glycan-binding domain-containing protein [Hyphomicrobiaceae bacterium]